MTENAFSLAAVVRDVLIHPTSWREDRNKLAVALAAYEEIQARAAAEYVPHVPTAIETLRGKNAENVRQLRGDAVRGAHP